MRVLVGCEFSGVVRRAFRARGHEAWSCDFLPAEDGSEFHIQGDVRSVLRDSWHLGIFHPPCTYLSSSGLHWNKRGIEVDGRPRAELTEEAVEFARLFIEANWIPRRAVENPVGCLSTRVRKPDQIIQPWQFGEDASKATCLWLHGLPKLVPTKFHPPRLVVADDKWVMRWANQTDSDQNRLGPSDDRWAERSKTYPGLAEAMADQWSTVMEEAA